MLMVGFLQWWYTRGWANFVRGMINKLQGLADFFSMGLLLKTFFSPFRQISAYESDNASFQQQISEFFDKLLSRIIGAVVRFLILICGIVALTAMVAFGGVMLVIWPLMPLMPIAGVILTIAGVAL